MEVEWRRLFPLCHTRLCSTQEWEILECSVSEWYRQRFWMGGSEAQLSLSVSAWPCGYDFTAWHWGISLKEYLHTQRVQNTCVSLSSLLLSQGPRKHTLWNVHRKLKRSWLDGISWSHTFTHTHISWLQCGSLRCLIIVGVFINSVYFYIWLYSVQKQNTSGWRKKTLKM